MVLDKNRKEVIRSVRGDIQPAELGRTNVHKHLLMRSPLLRGEELDDLERSAAEASEMPNAGIDALVELTPIGLGRDPRGIVKIAELSRLQIVLATGIHQQAHYSPEHWIYRIGTDELAGLFIRDINEGCDGAERIVLGGDVARRSSFRAYGGMPGMAYLPERFVPRLRESEGDELVQQILVTNPAGYLAFSPNAI